MKWLILGLLVLIAGMVFWTAFLQPGKVHVPNPSQVALDEPNDPIPPTPEPQKIVQKNGTMGIGDIREVGILATAIYTVTGDIARVETGTIIQDTVSYHINHTVVGGVDLGKIQDKDVVIRRLPSGGQSISIILPASEIFFVDPSPKSGVVSQKRISPVLFVLPLVSHFVPQNSALVNVATNDAQKIARDTACRKGLKYDAAVVARGFLVRLMKKAQFESVEVTPFIGNCP